MGVRRVSVTIASGGPTSEAIPLQLEEHVIAVQTPAAWTAADIGLDGSNDGATWFHILDGTATTLSYRLATNIPTSAAAYNTKNQNSQLFPLGYANVRLRSITTSDNTDANQGADRVCVVFISNDEL